MHRDSGAVDELEHLCDIPEMNVSRLRMRERLEFESETGGAEALVIPMAGRVKLTVSEKRESFELGEKDVCYLPRGSRFEVVARGPTDLLIARAPAGTAYGAYVKRFSDTPAIESGLPPYSRRIYTMLGERDPANRFIVGFVEGQPGNWTSFPPHRHDGKPEVYVYYGMGRKFGVQVVAAEGDEKAFVVREGDSVLFERGYHPNVATPSVGMNFVWIISADPKQRDLSVELHPEYSSLPMGATHLTTK
ncbi:MAG TPA: 5-deoxy-glucuronate isomerase [Nitrososphaerales archaeon]|nr:5-deoxy-glucuronate isomerase [Nitrososphaerales archaeon]